MDTMPRMFTKRVLLVSFDAKAAVVPIQVTEGLQPTVVYVLDDAGKLRMFRYDYTLQKHGERSYQRFSEAVASPVLARSLSEDF